MARLRRISDGAGDQGSRVQAIRRNVDTNELEIIETDKPIVGYAILVGAVTARTYERQDWWMTTKVEEILEEDKEKGYYKFRTENSIYEFWK